MVLPLLEAEVVRSGWVSPDDFLAGIRALESSYLASDDPRVQSGYDGGAIRWKEERGPIIEAIDRDGIRCGMGCLQHLVIDLILNC